LNERPERQAGLFSNERLEFLGDAVLNLLTASWLYHTFPERSEGEMTALRAALVKTATLARFANELRLGQYVRISRGEDASAARERPALLADLFEALLGAIYLDQGVDVAAQFVRPFLQRETERIQTGQVDIDYRTRLQELMQARHGITPRYQIVDVSGPDHCRQFTIEVLVEDRQMGRGSGSSKQSASQEAARAALQALDMQQAK
jgi:ribonuclease-3